MEGVYICLPDAREYKTKMPPSAKFSMQCFALTRQLNEVDRRTSVQRKITPSMILFGCFFLGDPILAAPETFLFHRHGSALNEIKTLHHFIRVVFFFAPSTRAAERRAHWGCVHGEFSVETS
jgi:hypothetical protein